MKGRKLRNDTEKSYKMLETRRGRKGKEERGSSKGEEGKELKVEVKEKDVKE